MPDESLTMPRRVRTAIAANGERQSTQPVHPEGAPRHPGWLLDVQRPVCTGRRERTVTVSSKLFHRNGFRLILAVPTAGSTPIFPTSP
ncbi:hypothetical protein [Mycolicibacterium hodleri]|uniref:Uncharacterized protein n=1 Tax=Mycolicibacterium hodleri TaxID=49897 RepID=A0A502EKM6_9MYCO|nr:hypothetical protein [Mycolicibacterium hodleri]TPG37046.1 hypothetical protein EAH80_04050 [Mycolicibacterium hodleri]